MTNENEVKMTPVPPLTWEDRRSYTPCPICGAPVRWMPSVPKKYCSVECSYAGRRTGLSVEKACEYCGNKFRTTPAKADRSRFCSRSCAGRGTSATKGRPRGSTGTKGAPSAPFGSTRLTPYGYLSMRVPISAAVPRGWQLQHRAVMAEHLGRALLPTESVHHMNGDRTDNRLENLELWSRSQPSGQRVTDLVAWARELLETYGDLVP